MTFSFCLWKVSLRLKLQFEYGLKSYLDENQILVKVDERSPEAWSLSDTKVQALLSKIKSKGKPLGEYVIGKIFVANRIYRLLRFGISG